MQEQTLEEVKRKIENGNITHADIYALIKRIEMDEVLLDMTIQTLHLANQTIEYKQKQLDEIIQHQIIQDGIASLQDEE